MRERLLKVRWRMLAGVISLLAAVAVTLPAAATRVDLGQRVADIWPNGLTEVADVIWPNALSDVADVIWPNSELMDVIWPNAALFGGSLTGTPADQNNQGNQN